MPDRLANTPAEIYADLPGFGTAVTVTVAGPDGTAVVTEAAATAAGGSRWTFALTAGEVARHGVYTDTWAGNGKTATRHFTVGPVHAGLALWDLRLNVAGRQSVVRQGQVTTIADTHLVDEDLLGAASNYRNDYVILHPAAGPALAGISRPVTDYTGSALVLARPFPSEPDEGTPYALLDLDPREVDRALAAAAKEVAGRARVGAVVTGLAVTAVTDSDDVDVTVPVGLLTVHGLWGKEDAEIAIDQWTPLPGRRLRLTATGLKVGDEVTVAGTRPLLLPRFEDGTLDMEAAALEARAALQLMASRAGGAGVDVEEHLRRQIIYQQEYESALRHAAGRPKNGSKPVID